MSNDLDARKSALEEQLAQLDSEHLQALKAIVVRMIEGRNIVDEEQAIEALEKLFPLSDQELNNVIEVLNLETRRRIASCIRPMFPKHRAKISALVATMNPRPRLEVKS